MEYNNEETAFLAECLKHYLLRHHVIVAGNVLREREYKADSYLNINLQLVRKYARSFLPRQYTYLFREYNSLRQL